MSTASFPSSSASGGADSRWAVVNVSSAIMRESPDYESAAVSQIRMGTLAKVLGRERYWVKIETPEPYVGWVNALCLTFKDSLEALAWTSDPRYICTAEYGHVYSKPSADSPRICDFVMGNIIGQGNPAGISEDSSTLAGTGAASRSSWSGVALPDGRHGWVPTESVADFSIWCDTVELSPRRLVSIARLFLGTPYMWGGTAPGHFDCSGLVGFCYYMCGVLLPRDAREQVLCGEEVAVSDMKAGDLVFFGENRIAHVALCTGPGRIIHSSQIVRDNSLNPSDSSYYGRRILYVRRVLDHISDRFDPVRISSSPAYFENEHLFCKKMLFFTKNCILSIISAK